MGSDAASTEEPFASSRDSELPFQETAVIAESAPGGDPPFPHHEAPSEHSGGDSSISLSDEQIDRIARRVVKMMSEELVRNIAWEVIPDMAEMFVKERIRELEAEA